MVKNCLIGHTGFVGTNLKLQKEFNYFFNSKNINDIEGTYDMIVCSAAPAKKWYANQNPEEDNQTIMSLIENLKKVNTNKFILISTIDVYSKSEGCNETTIDYDLINAYGRNRRKLEVFVEETFNDYMIVRLPGLVGEGLKKNIIYDLINNNQVEKINLKDSFQWYNLRNLWNDIEVNFNRSHVNLFTEPVSNEKIIDTFFSDKKHIVNKNGVKSYNNKTIFYEGGYIQNTKEVMNEIDIFIQSQKKLNR